MVFEKALLEENRIRRERRSTNFPNAKTSGENVLKPHCQKHKIGPIWKICEGCNLKFMNWLGSKTRKFEKKFVLKKIYAIF
jgi:hypothetical protein